MTTQSLDLSGKIDRFLVQIFEEIVNVAESVNTDFFVAGATARDIILKFGYDIETSRATNDIDLGVKVSDWDQYNKLRECLIATKKFKPTREPQRLRYQDKVLIDVIPFGAIEGPDGMFSWPPDHETVMNTLGFEESYRHSLSVILRKDPGLYVKFADQAGLALMKLIAWNDRQPKGSKDAKDLRLLMRSHIDAGNQERLFEQESDLYEVLAESGSFDYMKASARLLGRDISTIAYPETRKILLEILRAETGEKDRYRLVEDMTDRLIRGRAEFEDNLALLEELKAGILEGPKTAKKR
jgi:predicted nucleotidyltransferase